MLDIKSRLSAIRELDLTIEHDPDQKSLPNVTKGGFIEINQETYQVTNIYKYLDVKWKDFGKRKNEYWVVELQLLHLVSGESSFIEWEIDDELEISETLKEIKMREILFDGKPLSHASLEYIADEEYGNVSYAGKDYSYVEDDTWAALFYRDNKSEPLKVRMYEFESSDNQYLTVEAWQEDEDKPSREAFISKTIKKESLTVLQPGRLS